MYTPYRQKERKEIRRIRRYICNNQVAKENKDAKKQYNKYTTVSAS